MCRYQSEESYISAKEPYISTKEPYMPANLWLQSTGQYWHPAHVCVDTDQKSPTSQQKGPTYPQNSHTYLPNCDCRRTGQYSHPAHVCVDTNQQSPTSPPKSPTYPQNSDCRHTCQTLYASPRKSPTYPQNCDCRRTCQSSDPGSSMCRYQSQESYISAKKKWCVTRHACRVTHGVIFCRYVGLFWFVPAHIELFHVYITHVNASRHKYEAFRVMYGIFFADMKYGSLLQIQIWNMDLCYKYEVCVTRHDSFVRVIGLIYTCDMWHDSFIRVTNRIHIRDMTHSYVWHDSSICVIWLIHMCDMTIS